MPGTTHPAAAPRPNYVGGLDSIRFLCALWVVFSHVGSFPLTAGIDRSTPIGWLVGGIYGLLFPGAPAVIVFFVISGYVIHYPFRDADDLPLVKFYTRRLLRIAIPLAVAVAISIPLGVQLTLFSDSILWSLVCELIYYVLYPGLRVAARRWGWMPILLASYVLAASIGWQDPGKGNFANYGASLNWVVGLPCWLLGVMLASRRVEYAAPPARNTVWGFRAGVWGAAALATGLTFHSPLRYPLLLNLFALLAVGWLSREIRWFGHNAPNDLLERAGKWSYSLYLVHVPANALVVRLEKPTLGYVLDWFVLMGAVLVLSYIFYLLVERPSHRLARALAERFDPPRWTAHIASADDTRRAA